MRFRCKVSSQPPAKPRSRSFDDKSNSKLHSLPSTDMHLVGSNLLYPRAPAKPCWQPHRAVSEDNTLRLQVASMGNQLVLRIRIFSIHYFLPKAKKSKGWLGMMCSGDGVGRSMDFPSVCPSVTWCALQLARGHSNGERFISACNCKMQATLIHVF